MKIPAQLAQKIVETLKDSLNQQINFMDTEAMIIASTDASRVGNFHEGAQKVLRTGEALYIERDQQFIGTKKGVNVPVYDQKEIIGVIGLTGEREVEKYARIVKSMTEILVREARLNELTFQKRERNRLLMESLLLDSHQFEAAVFDLDFSKPYQVVVGSVAGGESTAIHEILERYFTHFTTNLNHFVILARSQPALERTLGEIGRQSGGKVLFGIGLRAGRKEELKRSYATAFQALNWLRLEKGEGTVLHFEKMELGIVLGDAKPQNWELFMEQVCGQIGEEDFAKIKEILRLYAKHNGSIAKCAEELFIHKNTFQYQLQKIQKQTGYDPRNYRDFAILHVAFNPGL